VPHLETELEEFFDLSIDPLSIVGFDGEFKRVNASFLRLMGYTQAELFSRSVLDHLHPDDVEPAREALAQVVEGHDMAGFEARVICADGAVRWIEWSTRMMPERGVIYGIGRDTTERRRVEAELREAQRAIEASRDELRVLAEEQAALRRVATLVAEGASPSVVLDAVAAEMERALGADAAMLFRYEPDQEATVVARSVSSPQTLSPGTRVRHEGENVTSIVRRTGRPARIARYERAGGPVTDLARAVAQNIRSAVGAPIVVDGRLWGVIIASWGDERSPPGDTEERMAKFAQLLDTAIANADSRDQLISSRARLLSAADEARRRVVRDLHDGAQQRLVHAIITLKLAQRAFRAEDGEVESLLSEALAQTEEGNRELRELAHGILPAVLTRGGLRAGVEALVARLDLPVRVDVPTERLPAEIEASAYFIVAEALTNVVKHAHAGRAEVTAPLEDGMLRIEVRDNGAGGADPDGHGLVGMRDRVMTLGGWLAIESPAAGGTLVTATLPLSAGWNDRRGVAGAASDTQR
jgi:PAS domain S-box-containing protein